MVQDDIEGAQKTTCTPNRKLGWTVTRLVGLSVGVAGDTKWAHFFNRASK